MIDNGSPDETSAVAARYPGVRCIRQSNQGLSAARNRGIQECQGDYISFLDADDLFASDGLAAGVRCLAEHPDAGFVFGTHRAITEQGELFATRVYSFLIFESGVPAIE